MQCYFFVFILSVNKAFKQLQLSIFHMNCRLSSDYRFSLNITRLLQRSRYMKIRIIIQRTCMIVHRTYNEWLCVSRCREVCAESFMAQKTYLTFTAQGLSFQLLTPHLFLHAVTFSGVAKNMGVAKFLFYFTALAFLYSCRF